jgi:hypothetical protein
VETVAAAGEEQTAVVAGSVDPVEAGTIRDDGGFDRVEE